MTDGSTTKKTKKSANEAVIIYVPEGENSSIMSFVDLCEIKNANTKDLENTVTDCVDNCKISNW